MHFLKFVFIFCFLALNLIGCESNNNPKDYWSLEEPKIHAWDTSDTASSSGIEQNVSKFSSAEIKANINYKSYIQFKSITPDIKFLVNLDCKGDQGGQNINASKVFKLNSNSQVFIYDLLPEFMIFEEGYKNSSTDFKCNFKFTAKNKVDSEHTFTISNLPINTHSANSLNIYSISNKSEDSKKLSIKNRNSLDPTGLSSLEIDDERSFEYMLESDISKLDIADVTVRCLGEDNLYTLNNKNNEFNKSLNLKFRDKIFIKNAVSFLKKCRAKTTLVPKNNLNQEDNTRTAWSEYFNVIFDRPVIEANVFVSPNIEADYPYNNGDYLDPIRTHIFDIQFTNLSKKDVRFNLPDQNSIQALQNPLIFNSQRHDFGKRKHDKEQLGGFLIQQLGQYFESNLEFMKDQESITSVFIAAGEKVRIKAYIEKNFACKSSKKNHLPKNSYSEEGFRLRAIPKNSEQDMLKLEYMNQGKLEAFPEEFYLSQTLHNTKSNKIHDFSFYANQSAKENTPETIYAIDTYLVNIYTQVAFYRQKIGASKADPTLGPPLTLNKPDGLPPFEVYNPPEEVCNYVYQD